MLFDIPLEAKSSLDVLGASIKDKGQRKGSLDVIPSISKDSKRKGSCDSAVILKQHNAIVNKYKSLANIKNHFDIPTLTFDPTACSRQETPSLPESLTSSHDLSVCLPNSTSTSPEQMPCSPERLPPEKTVEGLPSANSPEIIVSPPEPPPPGQRELELHKGTNADLSS